MLGATRFVPRKLIDIEDACRHPERITHDDAVHFYRWDWILNRERYTPDALKEILPTGTCLLTQDFSMFRDMFPKEILWNWYRAHLNAERMVQCGFRHIPSLSWAEEDTLDYCFNFIQPGGTVAVSTVGIRRDAWGSILFNAGMERAIQVLHPSCVIVYGGMPDFDFQDTLVLNFPNTSYQWTAAWQRKEVI
ncbi:MAG: DUF4417 domain-containing protein [Victivallales bacterium]|nr:DUF4417 domain-containing protein [Victivallales bacterium]